MHSQPSHFRAFCPSFGLLDFQYHEVRRFLVWQRLLRLSLLNLKSQSGCSIHHVWVMRRGIVSQTLVSIHYPYYSFMSHSITLYKVIEVTVRDLDTYCLSTAFLQYETKIKYEVKKNTARSKSQKSYACLSFAI